MRIHHHHHHFGPFSSQNWVPSERFSWEIRCIVRVRFCLRGRPCTWNETPFVSRESGAPARAPRCTESAAEGSSQDITLTRALARPALTRARGAKNHTTIYPRDFIRGRTLKLDENWRASASALWCWDGFSATEYYIRYKNSSLLSPKITADNHCVQKSFLGRFSLSCNDTFQN
jgi:hypothetical protein